MLTRVEIKGFKCLHDVGVDLGPFNVLIGPNDSGKSSFLQALVGPRHLPAALRRARRADRSVSVRLCADDGEVLAGIRADGTLDRAPAAGTDTAKSYMRISSPLSLDPAAIANPSPRGSGCLAEFIQTRGGGATAHLARVALGDRARYDAIQQGMRDITRGRVQEVVVGEDTGEGYPLSFRLLDGIVIPASEVSEGLRLYFAFLTIVHRDDAPATLLIEEPENGIHPVRLREIVTLLRSLTQQGVQIILTTHSPDLLNACKPEEVLVFRRPKPDSGTEIHRLPADFERRDIRSKMREIWGLYGDESVLDILRPWD